MVFCNRIKIQIFSSETLCSTLLTKIIFNVNLCFNLARTIVARLVYRVNRGSRTPLIVDIFVTKFTTIPIVILLFHILITALYSNLQKSMKHHGTDSLRTCVLNC